MKRVLFALLFAVVVLWGQGGEDIDVKIWKRLIFDIRLDAYRIYTADERLRAILCRIDGVELVEECSRATLIVDTRESHVDSRKCLAIPHLTDDYRTLLKNRDEIGAFFWLKGRPTIIIAGPRLKRFGLEVETELEDFVEEIE